MLFHGSEVLEQKGTLILAIKAAHDHDQVNKALTTLTKNTMQVRENPLV